MPGRTPRDAVDAFLDPLKDALSCIAQAKITLSRGGWAERNRTHALSVNDNQPVKLKCRPVLMLGVGMFYEIVPTGDTSRPPWRVTTRAYAYELQTSSGELVWSYHWHPDSAVGNPHAHLGRTQLAPHAVLSHKAHQPTGRVSLESVIRACITEFGVKPLREDWAEILDSRESDFQKYRSWP